MADEDNNKPMSPLAAGAIGVAVGAAAAGAGVYLSDAENREKLAKELKEWRDKAGNLADELWEKTKGGWDEAKNRADNVIDAAKGE